MNYKHLARHDWKWEVIHRDPFTVRRVCTTCEKKGVAISSQLVIQRESKCYFCNKVVTTWRTYADGTVACLDCVKTAWRKMA